jgi:hypothetical protein
MLKPRIHLIDFNHLRSQGWQLFWGTRSYLQPLINKTHKFVMLDLSHRVRFRACTKLQTTVLFFQIQ